MRTFFPSSSRKRLVYWMFLVWIIGGAAGFYFKADFMALAAYYTTFAGPVMMYIWGETRRPNASVTE